MPPGSDCCRACPSDRGSAPAVSSPRSGRAAPADLAGPKARCACNLTPTYPRPAHPLAPSQETRALCASSARRCEDRVPVAARDAGRVASARQSACPLAVARRWLETPDCRAPLCARRKRLHRSRRYQTACSCRQDKEGGSRVPSPRRGAGADSPGVAATRQMGGCNGGLCPPCQAVLCNNTPLALSVISSYRAFRLNSLHNLQLLSDVDSCRDVPGESRSLNLYYSAGGSIWR